MNLADPNLRAVLELLSDRERQAFEQAVKTGQAGAFAKQVFRKVKAMLKWWARTKKGTK